MRHFILLALLLPVLADAASTIVDTVIFADANSERDHALMGERSEATKGGLDESARRLLPTAEVGWEGGKVSFTMKVDPVKPNYFTIKLWGSDRSANRLILFCEGKQIGYRHLGDIDLLDIPDNTPAFAGRYFYNTTSLPIEMTKGRSELHFEIRSSGPIWGYGTNWEQYQKPMKEPTRTLHRVYTHTDGFFAPPPDEKQGVAPGEPVVRTEPGEEILAKVKERIAREIGGRLKPRGPLDQVEMQFLASAWHVKWTTAFQNPEVVKQVVRGADEYFRGFRKDPKLAQSDPRQANSDWQGLGALGDAVRLLAEPLKRLLDEEIDDGAGNRVVRRAAWSEMLRASRDGHRRARRQYTNQTMIVDLNIYLANRGVAAIDPVNALPEEQVRRYLYEAIGLQPWLGSDTDAGPQKPLGDAYWQLTDKGLTKELGFVGYYGEVLDWVTHIFRATCAPGETTGGDEKIKAQLAKIENARACFRYPLADEDGFRAMRAETIVGWRDVHYPGDVTYGERAGWEGSAIYSAAATLDPRAVGFAQQMFADNQFFKATEALVKQSGLRVSNTLLRVPDEYAKIKAQPASAVRLPMSPGNPDFAWADEEDGVLAVKHGGEILYVSLYWRARNAVNHLARVHYITPRFDRIAVVREQTKFEPAGIEYTRPDWVNFGFANGGLRYPGNLHSAHAGEKLPIAKIPAGIAFKAGQENSFAGRGTFYELRYGPYLIGMNMTKDKTFELPTPAGLKSAPELVSRKTMPLSGTVSVPPRSTVVLLVGARD